MILRRTVPFALLLCALLAQAVAQHAPSPEFASAERKMDWIKQNGAAAHPSPEPTVLTSAEWNAYLTQGGVDLPEGISHPHILTQPGMARGEADIDFDRLTANRSRSNPLLQLFTGSHHVVVVAQVTANHGTGFVTVQSVQFDGLEIPRFALELFAAKFLRPKYGPAYRLDASFRLKDHIDSALAGSGQVTIIQR